MLVEVRVGQLSAAAHMACGLDESGQGGIEAAVAVAETVAGRWCMVAVIAVEPVAAVVVAGIH